MNQNPEKCLIYGLKVQQGVHRLGLGVVVLQIHVPSELCPPFSDDDGQSWWIHMNV